MRKKEIIICIIVLLLSIASISAAVIVRDSKKAVTHIKETSTDIKNIEEEKEKNNTEKLNHPIDYDDLERKLLNLVNNEGYSIIKRNCEEKVGKEKKVVEFRTFWPLRAYESIEVLEKNEITPQNQSYTVTSKLF